MKDIKNQWSKYLVKTINARENVIKDIIDGKKTFIFKVGKDGDPPYDIYGEVLLLKDHWGVPVRMRLCNQDHSSFVEIPEIFLKITGLTKKKMSEMTLEEINGEGFSDLKSYFGYWSGKSLINNTHTNIIETYDMWKISFTVIDYTAEKFQSLPWY
jgi:hypothetical protein